MSLLKLTNGFAEMADVKLLNKGLFIHQEMSANTSIFANPDPAMPALKDACDEFQAGIIAAAAGGPVAKAQKRVLKQNLVDLLHLLGYYVLFTSKGDRVIAARSGFTLAKDRAPRIISEPTDVKAEYGNISGQMFISAKASKGASGYLHQYTTDPSKEENWISMKPCTKVHCEITGLTAGVMYYFRIGAVGSKDQIMYSAAINKIVA